MTDKLPHNLLQLFAPRPALRYLPPSDHAPEERKTRNIESVAWFLQELKDYDNSAPITESRLQKRDRLRAEKKEKQQGLVDQGINDCKLLTGLF